MDGEIRLRVAEALGLRTHLDVMDSLLDFDRRFIVDAGCGDMSLSRELQARGAHVLAIDPDPVQAAKNNDADTIPNVGFVQTGADEIPVEPGSVDGVIFSYSLHHVPDTLYPAVFEEVSRILKPDGFLYVLEPVASGPLNEIMQLFHDETVVRQQAQEAIQNLALPRFRSGEFCTYYHIVEHPNWNHFADQFAGLSYNVNYTEAEVRNEKVQSLFEELGKPLGYRFEVPMQVACLKGIKQTTAQA